MPKLHTQLLQLNKELDSLLTYLSLFPSEKLQQRPSPNAWSVMEILQHVMLAEKLSVAYVGKKIQHPKGLKKAGMIERCRLMLLRFFLYAPLKFKAPSMVAEQHFNSQTDLDTLANNWRSIRATMASLLEEFPPELLGTNIYRHALAGRLTLDGMFLFFEGHFRRHRKQIEKTLQAVGALQRHP